MKKIIAICIAATTLWGGTFQRNPPPPTVEETACQNDDFSLQVGGNYSYLWMKPHGFNTFTGNLGGAQLLFSFKPKNSFYEGVHFRWRQGSTKATPSHRFVRDFDTHARFGYTFGASDCHWEVTLFTGFGYRYIGQFLSQPGTSNLAFNYNEFYVPCGVLALGKICNLVTIGVNAIWMPEVYTGVTIVPLNGASWLTQRSLGNALVELPLTFFPTDSLTVELKPFAEYWKNGKTIATTSEGLALGVPSNRYVFVGAEINVGWRF